MGVRFYYAVTAHFNQADTVIPGAGNAVAFDRYAYLNNNPINGTDPTGHWVETAFDIISLGMTINDIRNEGFTVMNAISLVTDVATVVLPIVPAGVSQAIRVAKYASKAVNAVDTVADTAKVINKADDVIDLVNHSDDLVDTISRSDEIVDAAKQIVKEPYRRPSSYRTGVRDQAWEAAKDADGLVRDPQTGAVMNKTQPWDMGHKPGYEFNKHQQSARERDISRKQFLDEYNNPSHYRPELPSSNRNHRSEAGRSVNLWR